MGDVVHEGIEVDGERSALPEAAGDVGERGFGGAPRQGTDLAIDVVDAGGFGIGARDRASDRSLEQREQLGEPESRLGDRTALALPGVVQRLEMARSPARDLWRGRWQILGADGGALDRQRALGDRLDDQRRDVGVWIDEEDQALTAQLGRHEEGLAGDLDLAGLGMRLERAALAKRIDEALARYGAR